MTNVRRNLTDTRIAQLDGSSARCELRDSEVPGLIVRASASRKTFCLHTRVPGKKGPSRYVIGEVGSLSIEQAREIAREWHKLIVAGIDPAEATKRRTEAERAAREAEERAAVQEEKNLFAVVAEDYLKRKVARQRQARAVERIIRNVLVPAWGDKSVTEINRRDVVMLVEQIDDERQAPAYAQAAFGEARTMFNWIINRGIYDLERSPCDRIRVSELVSRRKQPRQRVLDDDELIAFWKATGRMPQPWRQLFRMILLTGARKTEMAGARWREIDLERRTFTVPPQRFKSEVSHLIPLTDRMCEILAELPRHKHGDFVFSFSLGVTPALILHQAKAKLDVLMLRYLKALARMRGDDPDKITLLQFMPGGERQWGAHDLRRTLRTRLAGLEVNDTVAEAVIGHGKRGLQRVYDQHKYEPQMRRGLELWSTELQRIVSRKPPTNVTPIRRRA